MFSFYFQASKRESTAVGALLWIKDELGNKDFLEYSKGTQITGNYCAKVTAIISCQLSPLCGLIIILENLFTSRDSKLRQLYEYYRPTCTGIDKDFMSSCAF